MNTDIYELAAKSLLGGELSDEEKTRLQKRNAKYELVRFLYMEKMKGSGLLNFQFSPGEGFEEAPTIDIVNSLLSVNEQMKDAISLDFGDGTFVFDDDGKPIPLRGVYGNPPHTGKTKSRL
jgi:hypothetical protein